MKSIKNALITGATSGIGKATAFALAAEGYHLLLTGRRKEKLSSISEEILDSFPHIKIAIFDFDIRDRNATKSACIDLNKSKIDVLINNAGLAAGLAKIYEGDYNDWEQMIDTNIKGLLSISREIIPGMIKNGSGHIINIGSIAGKEVYENGNVYCGTKHMVDALSKSMRLELAEHNIKVTAIHPGAVETEFSLVRFKGDEQRAQSVYQGFENLLAEDIADAILYCLTRPDRVNINDLVIMPKAQPVASLILRNRGL